VTIGFRYDGDGNRLAQIGDGTFTTHTLDIGLALPEVLARQGSGWSELYVHLPNAVATKEGTAWRYGAADGLGSLRQELDASGQVDTVNSYRPFGLPLEGDGGDPYGFTGEWWDGSEDRGLLFLRARYLEPKAGRFLSQDTIVLDFRMPQSIHRFTYVYNNP
jgi:RHS repeat-associated protein